MGLVPDKPPCLNEILDYGFRFDSSPFTDFNMDDFMNVKMYTGGNDGFDGIDKDGDFGSAFHMDVEMGVDDVDIFGSVQTHPHDVLESEKDMDGPVYGDSGFDQVAKGVATQGSTLALKRKCA